MRQIHKHSPEYCDGGKAHNNTWKYGDGGKAEAYKGAEGGLEGGLVDAMPHLLGYETSLSMLLNA